MAILRWVEGKGRGGHRITSLISLMTAGQVSALAMWLAFATPMPWWVIAAFHGFVIFSAFLAGWEWEYSQRRTSDVRSRDPVRNA